MGEGGVADVAASLEEDPCSSGLGVKLSRGDPLFGDFGDPFGERPDFGELGCFLSPVAFSRALRLELDGGLELDDPALRRETCPLDCALAVWR